MICMKLKKGTFSDFADRVRAAGKKVAVYGAGVIGQTVAPYWLGEFGLDGSVLCYVDADAGKQGKTVRLGSREVTIEPPEAFDRMEEAPVVLVTVSAFEPVAAALERIPALGDAEVYFLPVMLVERAHSLRSGGVVRTGGRQLIPKTIHYCWFSGNPIPDTLKRCMETWEKFCPDYEIVRWDESNYDISWSPYMVQAYEHKKWGFVPDVARLDILYRHGGIYLDTDVELIRSLDELLYQPAFCGVEKWGMVNFGGLSGAEKGNPAVKEILDYRKKIQFSDLAGNMNLMTCGYYESKPLMPYGFRPDNSVQQPWNGRITVYSSDYFHPFDYMSGETDITENTFSIHHFSGTWLGPDAAMEREKTSKRYHGFLENLEA